MAGNKISKNIVMAVVMILLIAMVAGITFVMTGCGDSTESMVSAPGTATGTPEDYKAVQDVTEKPAPVPSSETVTDEPGDTVQEAVPYSAAAADCRFYDDGICTKTGEACTECIVP